jgi:hypothetical protein
MQANPGPPYPAGCAVVRLGVAALLSVSLVNCMALRSDTSRSQREEEIIIYTNDEGHVITERRELPPMRTIRIAENLHAVRAASSIQLSLVWGCGGLSPKDPAVGGRLRRVGSELCHAFGDALKPVLPNATIHYHVWGPPPPNSLLACDTFWPAGGPPAQDPDVELTIPFEVRFHKTGTILEEGAISFRPLPQRRVIFEGSLWTATQKPSTTLEVSARTGKDFNWDILSGRVGPLFYPKADVDDAQLETALRAWGNTRAVELANELAIALRTLAAHE